ncbi:hypothetical protein [Nonomuraea sp. NPDC049695]|uniref:hypothetical protein n=1 Tax=Nonomuraea sp. NPDC049695 TaxID=3154734 RepID=UPI00341F358B
MNTPMRGLLAAGAAVAVVLSSGAAAQAATAAAAVPHYKAPKIFGTTFQADPKHDFTKGIHSRHNGILRGWITLIRSGVAEYQPIKWKKGTETEGLFVGPPKGDVMAYASPIAKDVVFLSAYGCKVSMGQMTVDTNTGLGKKQCSRSVLLKRHHAHGHPSLITVYKGEIVKVQEIYTP